MRYYLRRAVSLDSVDGCTHNPTRRRLGRSDISIREPVREVCLNSARQLITRGHGKDQNATQRFRKCLQLLRNVQLEKSVGWTQNPPAFGSWGFNSPSRHQLFSYLSIAYKLQKHRVQSACNKKRDSRGHFQILSSPNAQF